MSNQLATEIVIMKFLKMGMEMDEVLEKLMLEWGWKWMKILLGRWLNTQSARR